MTPWKLLLNSKEYTIVFYLNHCQPQGNANYYNEMVLQDVDQHSATWLEGGDGRKQTVSVKPIHRVRSISYTVWIGPVGLDPFWKCLPLWILKKKNGGTQQNSARITTAMEFLGEPGLYKWISK